MFFRRRQQVIPQARPVRRVMIEPLEERRLMSAALMHSAVSLLASTGTETHVTYQHVTGTVVSVNTSANTITISSTPGTTSATTQTTYAVSSTASITANGKAVSLGTLVAGVKVSLRITSATTPTVTVIHAVSAHVAGIVSAVDTTAGTITLTARHSGKSTTYTIPSTATVMLNGATSTLSAITIGSLANITFSAFSGTTVIRVSAHATSSKNVARADTLTSTTADGTLVSVDTSAGTLTLSRDSTQTTYTLASGATITADGATATLASLAVGDSIKLTLSAAGSTSVTVVVATGKKAEGAVSSVDTTASTITLAATGSGSATTYTIPTTATITVDGVAGTLAGIVAGSYVTIQYSATDNTAIVTVTDRSNSGGSDCGGMSGSQSPTGTVLSVDTSANTITVVGAGGRRDGSTETTYTLASNVTITADGKTATLASLIAGDQVTLNFSTTTPVTVTSITATGPAVEGSVTAVDTTADTITITPVNGTATTYSIASTATITIDGVTGTLAGITTGTDVRIQLSATDGKTVVSVSAGSTGSSDSGSDTRGFGFERYS